MALSAAIKPVSKAVGGGDQGVKSAVKRALGSKDDSNTSTADLLAADENNPQNTLKKFIENSSKTAAKAVAGLGSSGTNFGNSIPPNLAMAASQSGAGSLSQQLSNAWGGRNEGGGEGGGGFGGVPDSYGGDPNTAPGLNGYHFAKGELPQHAKPTGANVSDGLWSMVNNHLAHAFSSGDKLHEAIKPYLGMSIAPEFKQDAFSLSTFAMYKPTEDQIKSGKLDFLINDKRGYQDPNQRLQQLLKEENIDPAKAKQVMGAFGGIHNLANIDPRFLVQSIKDVDYMQNLQKNAADLREKGGGVDPKYTLVMHVVNDPGVDHNGVHNRNHGFRPGELSALKDTLPQFGEGSTSNVLASAIQGNDSQTRSQTYLNFTGEQMRAAKADYNLVLNYDSHGSGYDAHMGNGGDKASIGKDDYGYFFQIGRSNASASAITINFNSCHNGSLSNFAAKAVEAGVKHGRTELGGTFKDMVVVGRSTSQEGWLMMDGSSNYLGFWGQDHKFQTIHGSQKSDMERHAITIKGNEAPPQTVQNEKPNESTKNTAQNEKPNDSSKNVAQQTTEPKKTEEELIAEKSKRPDLTAQVA